MKDNFICPKCGCKLCDMTEEIGQMVCVNCDIVGEDSQPQGEFKLNVLQTILIMICVVGCVTLYYTFDDVLWLVILQIMASYIIVRRFI